MSREVTTIEPPPQELRQAVSILEGDDGEAGYDEPLPSRLHMAETVLRPTEFDLFDAVGGYAVANTRPLGLLVSGARETVQDVASSRSEISVDEVESEFGFVTSKDALVTVAAYQVARKDLLADEKEQRLRYLYGGASAYLDFEIGPEEFRDRVTARAREDPPRLEDLPARVQAAEFKQREDLSVANAIPSVRRVLMVDPGFDPQPAADTEESTEVPSLDPDQAALWGCPFCEYSVPDLASVTGHITASGGDHEGESDWDTSVHIPGYDESDVLAYARPQSAAVSDPLTVWPATLVDPEYWHTQDQREAAQADVPLPTQHSVRDVETIDDVDEIVKASGKQPGTPGTASATEDDIAPESDPEGADETEAGAPASNSPDSPEHPSGDGSVAANDGGEASGDEMGVTANGDTPRSTSASSAASGSSASSAASGPDLESEESILPEEERETPAPASDDRSGGAGSQEGAPNVSDEETSSEAADSRPEGESEAEGSTSAPEAERGSSSPSESTADETSSDTASPSDRETDTDKEVDLTGRKADTGQGRRRFDPTLSEPVMVEDGHVTLRSPDSREELLDIAEEVDRHPVLSPKQKTSLLGDLVKKTAIPIDIRTLRREVYSRREEAPTDEATQTHGGAVAETVEDPSEESSETPEQSVSPHDRAKQQVAAVEGGGAVETPVGVVRNKGEVADAAVEVYTELSVPRAEKAALVEELVAQANRTLGTDLEEDVVFDLISRHVDGDPRSTDAEGAEAADEEGSDDDDSHEDEAPADGPVFDSPAEVYDRAVEAMRTTDDVEAIVSEIETAVAAANEQGIDVSVKEVIEEANNRVTDD